MKIDDLITDLAKQDRLRRDLMDTLKKHAQDPETSARIAFALLEIGIGAFQGSGMCSHLVMSLCNMISHGATTETALKALMLIQEEDQLKDEIDPSRKERRAAANKRQVH